MKKYVKLYEEFSRPEDLEGFSLVKKISTENFMAMIRNKTIEHKNYVYRLINYRPRTELKWEMHDEMMIPIVDGDKKAVSVEGNNMYSSPFIVYPKSLKKGNYVFQKNEDGTYSRYTGKSKKVLETCIMSDVTVFSGISFSAFFGNRTTGVEISDTDFMKLVTLLTEVFDNEKRHESWVRSTRNYTGYIFDEVYVYEVIDPEEAAETIIEECEATVA